MRIVTLAMLESNQSVQVALTFIGKPGDCVLVTRGDEVRIIKASQLHRVDAFERHHTRLRDLPWESSEPVVLVSKAELGPFKIRAAGSELSGDTQALISSIGRRFLLVMRPNMNFLISSSEDNLVDYYCDPNHHPYSPPPAWQQGDLCWCGSPIRRDG